MNTPKKVSQTLKNIKLSKKEKILVALSGGKDSTVTAYLLKELGYDIEGLHIDLGMGDYSKKCLKAVEELCGMLGIKLHVYDIQKEMGSGMCYLRLSVQREKNLKNCAICGVIKKWILNREARKIRGVVRIATGHNLDDEAETFLLNVLKGSLNLSSSIGPITRNISDKKFVPRVKPLFFIPKDEIKKYAVKKKLPFNPEPCPCRGDSYRIQTREFLEKLSNKEKGNLIGNFMKLSKKIPKDEKSQMNYCSKCGEPARGKICKMCELLNV